jgi:serine/threonine protein kinase
MKPVNNSSTKEISISESPDNRYVCFNDIVGKGAYKIVYRGYDREKGIDVAWNSIDIGRLEHDHQQLIIDEVMMLKELSSKSKYIINFQNAWQHEDKVIFITELALSGTLKEYILQRKDNINLRVIKGWCKQILEGLLFLHDQNIAHRDIKCNNIFYNCNTGNILIGDFGLAKQRVSNFHTVIGTPEYMAPEMYEDDGYDEKVDIYAFGMCLLEMITKEIPYNECGGVGHLYKNVSQGIKPECLEKVKNEMARSIIEKCLQQDPVNRPSSQQLLDDPFFIIIQNEDNDLKLIKEDHLPPPLEADVVKTPIKANTIQDLLVYNLEQFQKANTPINSPENSVDYDPNTITTTTTSVIPLTQTQDLIVLDDNSECE